MRHLIRYLFGWFGRAEPLVLGQPVKVSWGPEDVIVVTTDRCLSQSEFQYMKEELTGFMDRADKVLVLPRGFDVKVIHRSAA